MFIYLEFSSQNDYNPKLLISALEQINGEIDVVEQKDAHLFMLDFIEILSKAMENPEELLSLITGEMTQYIKCLKCSKETKSIERFTSIGLGQGTFSE